MAPQKFDTNFTKASFQPLVEDTYDAAHVNLGNN
jgi:hypothetical protein